MRIKFKGSDPRAGSIATMDSSRGQHFIDIGAAEQVAENEGTSPAGADSKAPAKTAPLPGESLVSGKAADVIAALPAVTDTDLLKAALAAEEAKADKARSTVVDAIKAAIAATEKSEA